MTGVQTCALPIWEVYRLRDLLQEHAGVQDRYLGTGRVSPELAARLGLVGLAGRASAQAWDLRVSCPTPPYAQAEVRMATRTQGDVAARVAVRFDEIFESLRLIHHFVEHLPSGPSHWDDSPPLCAGIGVVGWRGGAARYSSPWKWGLEGRCGAGIRKTCR